MLATIATAQSIPQRTASAESYDQAQRLPLLLRCTPRSYVIFKEIARLDMYKVARAAAIL